MAGDEAQAEQAGWLRYEVRKKGEKARFWEVRRDGAAYVTRSGAIGSRGREQRKERDGAAACVEWIQQKIHEKKRAGYEAVEAPESALWAAIGDRDEAAALAALRDGADPHESHDGVCALEHAIASRATPIALALVDAGAAPGDLSTRALNPVWAVTTGRADVVRAFLDAGAAPNMQAVMGSPLLVAAREGQVEMVDALVEAGADLDVGGVVDTPLFAAIERGQAACALQLVRAGASPDPALSGRRSPLGYAAKAGMTEVVRALVEAGADLEHRDTHHSVDEQGFLDAMGLGGDDDEPLEAHEPGDQGAVVSMNLSAFVSRGYEGATPLIVAAGEGHAECVATLVEAGASLDALDERGRSAVQHARERGHGAIAAQLESAGADPDVQAPADQRLRLAAEAGDLAGLTAALAEVADVDAPEAREEQLGRTALMLAAANGHADLVDALVEAGAAVDRRDDEGEESPERPGAFWMRDDFRGRTALHLAAEAGHGHVVERLVRAGASPSPVDAGKNTPLVLAAWRGSETAVDALLRAGADPCERGAERKTPLHACVCDGGQAVAGALIDAIVAAGETAKLDWKDGDGETALHIAALLDLGDVVEKLLVAGANPNAKNREGERPSARTTDRAVERLLRDYERRDARAGREEPEPVDEEEERAKAARARTPDVPAPTARELEKTYEHESVLSRLQTAAEADGFRALLPEIGEACGSEPEDERASLGGYLFHVATGRMDAEALATLQERMLERGAFVCSCGRATGVDAPGRLLALPTTDRLDALAVFGTNGCNEDKSTADVMRWLVQREQTQPFQLLHVEGDTLEGRFLTEIADPEELAQSMYDLCGDIVDQGAESVEALAESLARTRRLYFWWD